MKGSQKLTLAGLLALVGIAVAGLVLTSRPPRNTASANKASEVMSNQLPLADEQLLSTAHKLAALAVMPQEQELAPQAVRLADRDADLAFADALRSASQQSAPLTAEAQKLQVRVAQLQSEIQADKDKVSQLKAEAARAKGAKQASLEGELKLAEAELDLQQDTLGDAQNDLARSGENAYAQIERLWQQHEASQHAKEAPATLAASSAAPQSANIHGGLIARCHAWLSLHAQQTQLLRAREGSQRVADALDQEHQALEQRVQAGQASDRSGTRTAGHASKANRQAGSVNSSAETTAALAHLRHLSQDEKNLADLDTRILDLRQLSSLYGQWASLVQVRERAALHAIVSAALWILLAVLIAYLVGQLLDRALVRLRLDRKQRMTLHTVARLALDVLTVLVILLIIFGSPRNMSTIVGLAGAGLAVALKDFIVAFFGWFILMGRHGIRVGDCVEINGVRGEAVEISLLRTILLETGNWNEPGHPTGRKVSFLNSYAVEGYYFNFTTSGQWLWDEIRVLIPWGLDPFPIIVNVEEAVKKETKDHAATAEREWQRAAHGYSVKTFSAVPSINLRTVEAGVEVAIHYFCPVTERYQLRTRLSQAAVKLIHEAKAAAPAAGAAASTLLLNPKVEPVPTADP